MLNIITSLYNSKGLTPNPYIILKSNPEKYELSKNKYQKRSNYGQFSLLKEF